MMTLNYNEKDFQKKLQKDIECRKSCMNILIRHIV